MKNTKTNTNQKNKPNQQTINIDKNELQEYLDAHEEAMVDESKELEHFPNQDTFGTKKPAVITPEVSNSKTDIPTETNSQPEAEVIKSTSYADYIVGARLKLAREKAGKTIPQMVGETRINLRHLQALEDGNYNVLGQKVYIKGYMRVYANALKLDAEDLVSCLEKELSDTIPETKHATFLDDTNKTEAIDYTKAHFNVKEKPKNKSFWFISIVLLILVLGGLFAWQLFSTNITSSTKEVEIDLNISKPQLEQKQQEIKPIVENQELLNVQPKPIPSQINETPVLNTTQVIQPEKLLTTNNVLEVFLADEHWVEITDYNSERIISKLIIGPQNLTFNIDPPFNVTIGNFSMENVQLKFQTQQIDLTKYIRGDVLNIQFN